MFADQLTIKQRLADAEKAATAAAQLEAADDYQLRQAVGPGSSWTRAPVRMSGHIIAAGVLPWSQVRHSNACCVQVGQLLGQHSPVLQHVQSASGAASSWVVLVTSDRPGKKLRWEQALHCDV